MVLAGATPSGLQVHLQVGVPFCRFHHGFGGGPTQGSAPQIGMDNHASGVDNPSGFPAGHGLQLAAHHLGQFSGRRRRPATRRSTATRSSTCIGTCSPNKAGADLESTQGYTTQNVHGRADKIRELLLAITAHVAKIGVYQKRRVHLIWYPLVPCIAAMISMYR